MRVIACSLARHRAHERSVCIRATRPKDAGDRKARLHAARNVPDLSCNDSRWDDSIGALRLLLPMVDRSQVDLYAEFARGAEESSGCSATAAKQIGGITCLHVHTSNMDVVDLSNTQPRSASGLSA